MAIFVCTVNESVLHVHIQLDRLLSEPVPALTHKTYAVP